MVDYFYEFVQSGTKYFNTYAVQLECPINEDKEPIETDEPTETVEPYDDDEPSDYSDETEGYETFNPYTQKPTQRSRESHPIGNYDKKSRFIQSLK